MTDMAPPNRPEGHDAASMCDSVGARWAAGIARVEVRHEPPASTKRVYLRLTLDEAKKLRADLNEVIEEREPGSCERRGCSHALDSAGVPICGIGAAG